MAAAVTAKQSESIQKAAAKLGKGAVIAKNGAVAAPGLAWSCTKDVCQLVKKKVTGNGPRPTNGSPVKRAVDSDEPEYFEVPEDGDFDIFGDGDLDGKLDERVEMPFST